MEEVAGAVIELPSKAIPGLRSKPGPQAGYWQEMML